MGRFRTLFFLLSLIGFLTYMLYVKFLEHYLISLPNPTIPPQLSIIIPAKDEDQYLVKTIEYTIHSCDPKVLHEIIIVDDASQSPAINLINKYLPSHLHHLVKVFRFADSQGLIRARILGSQKAESENLIFLDAHCKPQFGWDSHLLAELKLNYRRVACPLIEDIDGKTWEPTGTSGAKMMFDWIFEFQWVRDDSSDEIPIASGGIMAITKKWFFESGRYDDGMLSWGGENIEQSIRIWMCGGEIYVNRKAVVGHVFSRAPKPNPENKLVTQVKMNQKRGAYVWLDNFLKYFNTYHKTTNNLPINNVTIAHRIALRYRLKCRSFDWFVQKFRLYFIRNHMLDHQYTQLKHQKSQFCLASNEPFEFGPTDSHLLHTNLVLKPCNPLEIDQHWIFTEDFPDMIYHRRKKLCIDTYMKKNMIRPILKTCDWNEALMKRKPSQIWKQDPLNHIFTSNSDDNSNVTKNARFFCLISELPYYKAWNLIQEGKELKNFEVRVEPCRPGGVHGEWEDPQVFKRIKIPV